MKINELEKACQDPEKLDGLLKMLEPAFTKVDYWGEQMRQDVTDIPAEAQKAIRELGGAYGDIKIALSIIEAEKTNREEKEYNRIRIETENNGGKFTSASAEKQASVFVAPYRRVRNIIEGYLDVCDKRINVLQTLQKYMAMDKRNIQPGD